MENINLTLDGGNSEYGNRLIFFPLLRTLINENFPEKHSGMEISLSLKQPQFCAIMKQIIQFVVDNNCYLQTSISLKRMAYDWKGRFIHFHSFSAQHFHFVIGRQSSFIIPFSRILSSNEIF